MKKIIWNGLKISLLALTLNSAFAAEEKTPTIPAWLYKELGASEAFINKQDYPQARKTLQKALGKAKKGSYAQAITLSSLASIYALDDQYKKAAKLLAAALATEQLTEQQQQEASLNLGQLYMGTEQYQKAINKLAPWLRQNPSPKNTEVRVLLANAYSQLKQYRKALPHIDYVIKHSRKPKESWLQFKLAISYHLKDYASAASVLRRLMARYPDKKEYWQQLATVYQQMQKMSAALSIQQLAYEKGFLRSEAEILHLVNLYLYKKQPYQAANLLDKELGKQSVKPTSAHWELLATAWANAREYKKAINALEKASALHPKGKLYLQLGRIHVEQELWQAAIKALHKALAKGGLNREGEAYILLGMSYYETQQISEAQRAFKKAQRYSKTKKSAGQWLNYINTPV
ncbi:MAG: tetratricopeptide repeat protein [Methyloprofundus sp.]|nr:tetratricopeptide repeat protein [Methyloprofundus sp.]